MKRLILCAAAVAALLAAPVIADAKPAKHRAIHRTVAHKGGKATAYRGNDPAGNAAVDNLNAQSLANARGGAAR